MSDVFLLVGLGNPSLEYSKNRHNVGFNIIDLLAEKFCVGAAFKKQLNLVEICSCIYDDRKIILAKPLTYMNLSGKAVKFLQDFYKIPINNIYVFHDDIDLKLAQIKIKLGGSAGGHNGLKSIDNLCGNNYYRIRIGIDRPEEKSMVSNYVLGNFSDNETEVLSKIFFVIINNFDNLFANPKNLEIFCKKIC